jgi:hypothetical protein
MRASATCCTVIMGVVKYEAVSAQTVSLNGFGSAKYASERLSGVSIACWHGYWMDSPQADVMLQNVVAA